MKRQQILLGTLVLALVLLGLLTGLGLAQGPQPPRPLASEVALGTAFTYQGQLKSGGEPVDGECEFQFTLHDAHELGSQVGMTQTETITVTEGLFSAQLDFGPDAFTGEARWLGIGVKCPGDSDYTTLTPRQSLTPVPYALALPGLRPQQNSTSPNLIGGYSGNQVTGGAEGATIGGGGAAGEINTVAAMFGTIGGGRDNYVPAQDAVVAGGWDNTASGSASFAGGGEYNWANGDHSTIGGGQDNIVSSTHGTIAGGWDNYASGNAASIGGGEYNWANGNHSTIAGGRDHVVSSTYGTIAGGWDNTAAGNAASIGGGEFNWALGSHSAVAGGQANAAWGSHGTVAGGQGNVAWASHSTVPGGYSADAGLYGQLAYASGSFAERGDAQASVYVLRNTTSAYSAASLYLDGTSVTLTAPLSRSMAFDILVTAAADTGDAAAWHIVGAIKRTYSGGTQFIGTPVTLMHVRDVALDTWYVDLSAASHCLDIQVFSIDNETIHWVATVRTVETTMP
jgi:hypothetical protein